MKNLLIVFCILLSLPVIGQPKSAEELGYKHLVYTFKSDKIDILVKSKKGDENKKKPLFFFCQGSLPQPLIKYDSLGVYGVFPFNPDSLATFYHLVIVSKPFIPLIADVNSLGKNFTYVDKKGAFPKEYSDRNLLDYYVERNIAIIKYLKKQPWVEKSKLVAAGHSEGSAIASKMASESGIVTHLIYSGGNPMGRIMSMIQQSRSMESYTDSIQAGEAEIKYWENVVKNKSSMDDSQGDTHKTTYQFSNPPVKYLEKLKIPVLVCYGTKDWSAPFNDYFRVDMIRQGKKNFTFKAYVGTEHNYFPIITDNTPDFDTFNWDRVANDWKKWLNDN